MARPKQTQALARWDEELAKAAQVAAGMEQSSGGGKFFSLKAGQLTFGGAPMAGNEMAVVILDSVMENVFYAGRFVEGEQQGPKCFAFGRGEGDMAPHEVCFSAKSAEAEMCKACPKNEWGSAEVGKGKACRNTRRLAMIPAGAIDREGRVQMIEDEEHYKGAEVAYMRLPVTSVQGYASYVTQLAAALKRPPFGVVTRVKVVPDPKSQFKVTFTAVQPLPDSVMGAVMARHNEIVETIAFPYVAYEAVAAPAPKPGRKSKF